MMTRLSVSVVCYNSIIGELRETLSSLIEACECGKSRGYLSFVEIILVNNGPGAAEGRTLHRVIEDSCEYDAQFFSVRILGDGKNVGYGTGHNLAIKSSMADFHLVLNPDVEVEKECLARAFEFFDRHPDCGMLAPSIASDSLEHSCQCRSFPTVTDLFLRGFAPPSLRKLASKRMDKYEMRDASMADVTWDPAVISGCFMLARKDVLLQVEGFDENFFLYFEDFDLTIRLSRVARVAYVPWVKIVHHGGGAAKKGWIHIWMFSRSAVVFFSKHGWAWF